MRSGTGRAPGRAVETCLNCGEGVAGQAYCAACGQRAVAIRGGLGELVREAYDTAVSLDSKAVRTAWALFARPGVVAAEFISGHRVRWVSPVRLFLVVAALYVFVAAPYAQRMMVSEEAESFGRAGRDLVSGESIDDEKRRELDDKMAEYQETLLEMTPLLLRVAYVGSLPVVILLFALVEVRRRRPLYDHAVTGLYFMCVVAAFQLLDTAVAGIVQALAGMEPFEAHMVANVVNGLALWALTVLWLRRIYGDRLVKAVAKGAVILIGFEISMGLVAGIFGVIVVLSRVL